MPLYIYEHSHQSALKNSVVTHFLKPQSSWVFYFSWLPSYDWFVSRFSVEEGLQSFTLGFFFFNPTFFFFLNFQLILCSARKEAKGGKGSVGSRMVGLWFFPPLDDNVQIYHLKEQYWVRRWGFPPEKKSMDSKWNAGQVWSLALSHICWKLFPEDYIMVLIHVTWSAKMSSGYFLHSIS